MNLNFIALKIKNVFYTPPADVTTTKIQCKPIGRVFNNADS